MQRYDQSANYCMIYAAQVPWRSWIQALSRNHKTSGEKCYKLDWNPDPSNAAPEWQAGSWVAELGAGGGLSTRRACSKCLLPTGNVCRLQLHKQHSFNLSYLFNNYALLRPELTSPPGLSSAEWWPSINV